MLFLPAPPGADIPHRSQPSPPPIPARFREWLPWRRGRNWICSPAGINPSCCLLLLSSQRIFNKVTVYRSLVFVLLSLCCVLNPEGFHHNLLLSPALQIPPLLHKPCPLDQEIFLSRWFLFLELSLIGESLLEMNRIKGTGCEDGTKGSVTAEFICAGLCLPQYL